MKFALRWILLSVALAACSKSNSDPQIFVPRLISPQGEDLSAAQRAACDPSKVNFSDTFLTQQNFQAMFNCANYDKSLEELKPLFSSRDFPQLLNSINLVTQNGKTQTLKQTLGDWLEDGPQGTSRVDRLLPFLSSLIRNPSFQDGLPVLNNILQAGTGIWNELLPKLADVVYTDRFPDTLDDSFDIFSSFTSNSRDAKDYATGLKRLAHFLQHKDENGQTVASRGLGLLDEIRDLQPDGTSLHQYLERMLEFGVIDDYFLNNGSIRGEVIEPKLNEQTDDESIACDGLNDSAEHRQQCASMRLWRRGADGSEAPITQLAGLVVEFQKDHSGMLQPLAKWLSQNGPRVEKALGSYVIRLQTITELSRLKIQDYVKIYAAKNNIDLSQPTDAAGLSDLLTKALASDDFSAWLATVLPPLNTEMFGDRNAELLAASPLAARVAELFRSPELAAYANVVLPNGKKTPIDSALTVFDRKYHSSSCQITFNGKKQAVVEHLSKIWISVTQATLGREISLHYVLRLIQNEATDLADQFKNKGQPLGEWYFNSPYGSPGTTEMLVAYSITTLGLLDKYYQHRDWLRGEFADEVYGDDAEDKRAFVMLLDQVPNIVTYVRSGASRTGSDLSRAMAKDTNGYLVKAYVNLIVKATEKGWVSRAARLMEEYQAMPDYSWGNASPASDDIADRRKTKIGVEALDRILRNLTEPEDRDDYDTTTLSRVLVPLGSIVRPERRAETETLINTSAQQIIDLDPKKINDFFDKLHEARPPGDAILRRESYKSVADVMRNQNCPELILHLTALFRDNAVKPALDFFATKIDDGSLQRVLLFVRRLLGYAR